MNINELLPPLATSELAKEKAAIAAEVEAEARACDARLLLANSIPPHVWRTLGMNPEQAQRGEDGMLHMSSEITVYDVTFILQVRSNPTYIFVNTPNIFHSRKCIEPVVLKDPAKELADAIWRIANEVALEDQKKQIEATKRAQMLKQAARVIELAKQYCEEYDAWLDACEAWVQEWTEKLWEPVKLWRVRYVPVSAVDVDELIEEIVVLDDPTDIAHAGPGAKVDRVMLDGRVVEFAIGAFLSASAIPKDEVRVDSSLPHHRAINVSPAHKLNIPPTVLRNPDTSRPVCNVGSFASYLEEHAPEIHWADVEKRIDYSREDCIEQIAEMTPGQYVDKTGPFDF